MLKVNQQNYQKKVFMMDNISSFSTFKVKTVGQISRVKSTPDQLLGLIEQPLVVPVIGCITDRIDGREKLWSTTIFQESSITKFSNPIILVSTSREIMNSINIISAKRDQDIKFSVSMSYLGVKRWFRTTARRPKITMHNDLCQVSKYYHHQPAPHQSQRSCSVVETRRKPQNLFVRAGRSCQSKRYPCWRFGSIQGFVDMVKPHPPLSWVTAKEGRKLQCWARSDHCHVSWHIETLQSFRYDEHGWSGAEYEVI